MEEFGSWLKSDARKSRNEPIGFGWRLDPAGVFAHLLAAGGDRAGVIPRPETAELIVTLQELAAQTCSSDGSEAAEAEHRLQAAGDAAVPHSERLPAGAGENPLSEHVAEIAQVDVPLPAQSTLMGGDPFPR